MNEQSEVPKGQLHFLPRPSLFTWVTLWNCMESSRSRPFPVPSSTSARSLFPLLTSGCHLLFYSSCRTLLRCARPCTCIPLLPSVPAMSPQDFHACVPAEGGRTLSPLWLYSRHGYTTQSISRQFSISLGSLRPISAESASQIQGTRTSGFWTTHLT